MTPHTQARIDRLDRLANNLDSRYRLPLTNIRFGWDAILGLVPGIGDIAALAPAAYIWLEAHRMGASNGVKLRMAGSGPCRSSATSWMSDCGPTVETWTCCAAIWSNGDV